MSDLAAEIRKWLNKRETARHGGVKAKRRLRKLATAPPAEQRTPTINRRRKGLRRITPMTSAVHRQAWSLANNPRVRRTP